MIELSYYDDIYKKRLNRYGDNNTSRLEGGRRAQFENFLKSSPHYVTFLYNNETIEAVLEPFRQNETKNLMHILCRADQTFEVGSIVEIQGEYFMFYYWDHRKNSGYNRWVIAKMSHDITWTARDGFEYSSKAYMYFQQDNMLQNELKSRSRSDTIYLENLKLNFLLMPITDKINIGTYFVIETMGIEQFFRVTGYDIVSTPGVMYISMDPTYERDESPRPEQKPEDPDSDFFWLRGE